MFRFSFLLLALPLLGELPAQARPVAPSPLALKAALMGEYIQFRTVETVIDCQALGGPLYAGPFTSPAATIEVDSSAGIQLSYANGSDLKNGPFTLPTTFEFAVRGPALFDGKATPSPGEDGYSAFGDLPERKANQSGAIEFAATPVIVSKGLKARIVADRRGLQDRAGKYTTEIVLNWAKF